MVLALIVACCLTPISQMGAASPARQTGVPTLVLAHTEYLIDTGWSPDGRWILTYTNDSTVHIWDAQTGLLVVSLPHSGELPKWSPNSARLVTWQDGKAWVWEVVTWGALAELSHTFPIYNVFWRPDSAQVAILISERNEREDAPGEYHLWDVPTGAEILVLNTFHNSWRGQFIWSYDSQYGASTGGTGIALQVWDLTYGTEITELRQPGSLLLTAGGLTATWGNYDNRLLMTHIQGGAIVINVPNRSTLLTIRDDMGLTTVLWSKDQSLLTGVAIGSRRLPIWNGQTGELLRELRSEWLFMDVAWSDDGQHLLTMLFDGNLSSRLAVWDTLTGEIVQSVDFANVSFLPEWSATGDFAWGLLFTLDGVSDLQQLVRISTGEVILSFDADDVVWHPTENRLLTVVNADSPCTADCTYEVQVWDFQ